MKMNRTPAPKLLDEKWEEWGSDYKQRLEQNPNYRFVWRRSIDTAIRSTLVEITQNHCCYCDGYPLNTTSRQTIDHFIPKTLQPLLAYQWENLFLCCDKCQERNNKYTESLLKPDMDDYDFHRYFIVDYHTGELQPNPTASPEDQHRAEETIKLFNLERLNFHRRQIFQQWNDLKDEGYIIDDFPYRFMLE